MNSADDLCALIVREIGPFPSPDGTGAEITIDRDTPLLESGIVDSLGVLKLVTAIEADLGVEIPESKIVAAHFRTPGHLWEFVSSMRESVRR
jgi:acyl carrier protein